MEDVESGIPVKASKILMDYVQTEQNTDSGAQHGAHTVLRKYIRACMIHISWPAYKRSRAIWVDNVSLLPYCTP